MAFSLDSINMAINDAIEREVRQAADAAIKSAQKRIESEIRKSVAEIALRVSNMYEVYSDRNYVTIRVKIDEKKETV